MPILPAFPAFCPVVAKLIFPVCRFYFFLFLPHSTTSSLWFPPSFLLPLPLKPAGKPLRKAPKTPEKSPRKTSQNTLPASSLPKRKSEKVPEKPLFLCFLKGSGEEETRKEKDEEEKKPRAIRWPEKGKRGGEKDTQRGPDFYLSFLPPQEKLKSAGRKD
ncbi:hypothetical protein IMSAGC003_02211 [Lachnospiraceae bacterium]|nr:hypothetical protein [Lachnospiraceae bacterium]GFH95660.1 hypothetical protein IMSAGC003_02211 [Lachnospiraceae bacterium]